MNSSNGLLRCDVFCMYCVYLQTWTCVTPWSTAVSTSVWALQDRTTASVRRDSCCRRTARAAAVSPLCLTWNHLSARSKDSLSSVDITGQVHCSQTLSHDTQSEGCRDPAGPVGPNRNISGAGRRWEEQEVSIIITLDWSQPKLTGALKTLWNYNTNLF